MRIISKFHDYYDSVQSVGYDPHLIYNRVCRELWIPLNNRDFYRKDDSSAFLMPVGLPPLTDSFLMHVNPTKRLLNRGFMTKDGFLYLIGFCGKYYLTLRESHGGGWGSPSEVNYFYDRDSVVKYFAEVHKREANNRVFNILGECTVNPFSDPFEPFRVLNSPVFCMEVRDRFGVYARGKKLTVNPELSSMQFYRMFDSYSAYQEIAMFLSGVLGWPENATTQISDEDMRDAKGFNRWSFKTMPTKRKRA